MPNGHSRRCTPRTICPVDVGGAAVIFGLIGLGIGLSTVLAFRVSDRYFRPPVPPPEPAVAEGVSAVLSVLRSAAVVMDMYDEVLLATAPARALGIVKGSRLAVPELLELTSAVRRDQVIRAVDLEMPQGVRSPDVAYLSARVAPLSSQQILVLVEDRTKERRLDVVRRDFVANISHELKTPIGALTLLSEAVRDAADDAEAVQRFSARMQIEAERLSRLVAQIIELSRVQGDDPAPDSTRVEIDALVEAAIDRSGVDAHAKQIVLIRAGEHHLTTRGSQPQLTLALGNLVENAVSYSDVGTRVVVDVRTAMSSHARSTADTVEISVTDQGIGIAESEQARIFERFYRVDRARSRATGGTGLGLSIVKHITAGHRGSVRLWSVPGRGSTFTMSLPLGDHVRTDTSDGPDDRGVTAALLVAESVQGMQTKGSATGRVSATRQPSDSSDAAEPVTTPKETIA
jgi:two-component system sensor histidine kinase SenX3